MIKRARVRDISLVPGLGLTLCLGHLTECAQEAYKVVLSALSHLNRGRN